MKLAVWLLLIVLLLILSGAFALTKQAKPAYDWLNGNRAEKPPTGAERRMALTAEQENHQKVEHNPGMAPQFQCPSKLQHCPTQD